MAGKKQTRGICLFCGKEMTKGSLSRHLKSCPERQQAAKAAAHSKMEQQTIYHLQILDAWTGAYWLHLEVNGAAKLQDLDYYLRAIWLECCGHMSMFSFGGWQGEEIAKSKSLARAIDVGDELTHIYDFGTESVTLIRVVDKRKGPPLSHEPIKLMARNHQPELQCSECDGLASWLCTECIYELDTSGLLCDLHQEIHPHEDYGGAMPIVNSPRTGVCGYVGPAEPPY